MLITDEKSTIDSEDIVASATEAKTRGITVFATGVTDMVDQEELQLMSSDPQLLDVTFFISPRFEALEYILASVGAHLKQGKNTHDTAIELSICDNDPFTLDITANQLIIRTWRERVKQIFTLLDPVAFKRQLLLTEQQQKSVQKLIGNARCTATPNYLG